MNNPFWNAFLDAHGVNQMDNGMEVNGPGELGTANLWGPQGYMPPGDAVARPHMMDNEEDEDEEGKGNEEIGGGGSSGSQTLVLSPDAADAAWRSSRELLHRLLRIDRTSELSDAWAAPSPPLAIEWHSSPAPSPMPVLGAPMAPRPAKRAREDTLCGDRDEQEWKRERLNETVHAPSTPDVAADCFGSGSVEEANRKRPREEVVYEFITRGRRLR